MSAAKLATLLVLALWLPCSSMAADVGDAPVAIVVTGRQPGPPLWKVSKGDKVLWIFPYLNWVPQGMIWESERVARVIAESQEVLGLPETGMKVSALQMLNPFTVSRSMRNMERTQRNPDGGTLEANLPPELYARFATLQARYSSGNDYPRELRPAWVGAWMLNVLRKQEGLVPGDDIVQEIHRLVRRNRGIRRTEISVRLKLGNDFKEYEERLMAVWESVRPEQEQACFDRQLRYMEEDLDEMKNLANSWAQGYIDKYRDIDQFHNASLWPYDTLQACAELLLGSASLEHEAMVDMITQVNRMWLIAAENALATNASSLAILPINELLAEDGLLNQLKAKGYEVREPR